MDDRARLMPGRARGDAEDREASGRRAAWACFHAMRRKKVWRWLRPSRFIVESTVRWRGQQRCREFGKGVGVE
jgi:hypothetical protein